MKPHIRNYIKRTILALIAIYIISCGSLYFFQEKILFHPEPLPKNVGYLYENKLDHFENNYLVEKDVALNTFTFKANEIIDKDKLIFYIHGNSETLRTADKYAFTFTDNGYDCFVYDYRGYGKSDGTIDSEAQLFADAQVLYNKMTEIYDEKDIIIVGYSIGTGIASWLASKHNPNKLILQAPYYSMKDMMSKNYPIVPTFLLRYPLETNKRLKEAKCPIFILHGDKDDVIPYSSSQELKKLIPSIDLTTIKGLGHTGFTQNKVYQDKIYEILSN